jgi:hypothetical protein
VAWAFGWLTLLCVGSGRWRGLRGGTSANINRASLHSSSSCTSPLSRSQSPEVFPWMMMRFLSLPRGYQDRLQCDLRGVFPTRDPLCNKPVDPAGSWVLSSWPQTPTSFRSRLPLISIINIRRNTSVYKTGSGGLM